MLLLLLPEQIHTYWEDIKEGMHKAVAQSVSDRDAKVLQKLLIGMMQVWISYDKEGDETVVNGAVITALIDDQVHETRNLLLYCLWAISETHQSTWLEGIEALRKFAKSKGCNRVVSYSDLDNILGLCRLTKGEARYTFLTWDV